MQRAFTLCAFSIGSLWCSVSAADQPGASPQTAPKFDKKRTAASACDVTEQVHIPGGKFHMGSQYFFGDKLMAASPPDGAGPRKIRSVEPFHLDTHPVTNAQFDCFVKETGYVTETELYGWSFVFEPLASASTVAQADDKEKGLGRVKDSPHWLGVHGVSYRHPHGPDSGIESVGDHPVVQVSYRDASDYCKWTGARLPTEKEWEFAARAGQVNMSYSWGKDFLPGRMNIWEGEFPNGNTLEDGYLGSNPVDAFPPNGYGLHDMLGNVWEWAAGGKPDQRVQRGGGFIDTQDGRHNHAVMTSTRQVLSGDSTADTQGFRCASKEGRAGPVPVSDAATDSIDLDL